MVRKIIVSKKMTDSEIAAQQGDYFDESHYSIIVKEDTDVYTDTGELLLKFRKGVLSDQLGKETVRLLSKAARKKHENRGASAGPLDRNKMARYIGEFVTPGKFRTRFKSNKTGILSKQATSNLSPSNIIGYFDKADRNLRGKGAPCRLTAFNRDYPEIWDKVVPFLKECDHQFEVLIPDRYALQKEKAMGVPDFSIKDTAFSTITINYSWRTALHRDKGDLVEGFGNLIVLEDPDNINHYDGCYTGFPQYKICVDVNHGDFLAMNVHEWHCNTEFKPLSPDIKGKWTKKEKDNGWYFNRMSMVCYLREKMLRCKDMKTNKMQLLDANTKIYHKAIKKYPRPNSREEYLTTLNYLKQSMKATLREEGLYDLMKDYLSYLIYYYQDIPLTKTIKKQLDSFVRKIKSKYDKNPTDTNLETLIINYGEL